MSPAPLGMFAHLDEKSLVGSMECEHLLPRRGLPSHYFNFPISFFFPSEIRDLLEGYGVTHCFKGKLKTEV